MRRITGVLSFASVLFFCGGLATGLSAQTLTDLAQRKEIKRDGLSGAPNMEIITSMIEIKPSGGIDLHGHHGIETTYVIQGASIQSQGKEPTLLATGASSINLRDVKHAGFKVVGDTPLKLFTVHVVEKGMPLYEYTK